MCVPSGEKAAAVPLSDCEREGDQKAERDKRYDVVSKLQCERRRKNGNRYAYMITEREREREGGREREYMRVYDHSFLRICMHARTESSAGSQTS